MWERSGPADFKTFAGAQNYIENLNRHKFAGYSDWRLPTLEEAMSLMEPATNRGLYIDAKFDAKQRWIWMSDIYSAGVEWVADFDLGSCHHRRVTDGSYVRVVR